MNMIKSSITKEEYEAIYGMLNEVSALPYDCGQICGAACCACADADESIPEDEAMGIHLLPGEEAVFDGDEPWLGWSTCLAQDYAFPDSWQGEIGFLYCKANCHCDREKRPMQCRTFPLAPHFDENGKLCMIFEPNDLPYKCPLIFERDKYPLTDEFKEALYNAWEHLIKDPLIRDLVQMDTDYRIEFDEDIIIAYRNEGVL